ncbi:MAG TPA: M48 family metallopeptidase [Pyrinomonadaceae bacterium]|jgi:Zn-dependent protease with chaperone function
MTIINHRHARNLTTWLVAFVILAMPLGAALGQTRIEVPKNRYDIRADVQAGQQAKQQVEQQMPILRDGYIDNYVEQVGQRLVSAIPSEFGHPEFRYEFDVIDARDINAFALPGGPMYVNRGMIEAARTEGEMAGVMAHEISHVALRHATAQATETQKYQIGSVLGQVLGGVIGGPIGGIIGAGSQIGFGAGALKYSRKYETQADILGAQIMARAGYDPRDLANMFRTIQQQGGGSGGPEWLSSHPNPGNRYERINQEAAMLRVNSSRAADSREFRNVQARLRGMPRARSMEEIARSGQRYPSGGTTTDTRYPNDNRYPDDTYGRGERVAYPSTRYRTAGTNLFRVNVPDNWREFGNQNGATYAPEGAYGQSGITHGVMFGTDREQSTNLRQATDQYINDLLQSNNYLRPQSRSYARANVGGREGLSMTLAGLSPITGRNEVVTVVTTMLRSGDIFYMAAVAPQDDYRNYQRTFTNILSSLQLNDRY